MPVVGSRIRVRCFWGGAEDALKGIGGGEGAGEMVGGLVGQWRCPKRQEGGVTYVDGLES